MARTTSFLRVRFSDPGEFVEELEADLELVERKIVRLTALKRPAGPNGVLERVTMHAGAIVSGRPVILERHIGDLWGAKADDDVLSAGRKALQDLEVELKKRGLEVRPGTLEANDD